MSLYGYKNVQLITHRTQRQIADSRRTLQLHRRSRNSRIPGGSRAIRTLPAKEEVMSGWPTIRELSDEKRISGYQCLCVRT
jgi:hypothetical protein